MEMLVMVLILALCGVVAFCMVAEGILSMIDAYAAWKLNRLTRSRPFATTRLVGLSRFQPHFPLGGGNLPMATVPISTKTKCVTVLSGDGVGTECPSGPTGH